MRYAVLASITGARSPDKCRNGSIVPNFLNYLTALNVVALFSMHQFMHPAQCDIRSSLALL